MADEPHYTALERLVERNHKDLVTAIDTLGLRMERYVLERVYQAESGAMLDRIERLEKEAEADRQTARANEAGSRQTARMAILTAVGAFVGALALAALSAWVRSGGH